MSSKIKKSPFFFKIELYFLCSKNLATLNRVTAYTRGRIKNKYLKKGVPNKYNAKCTIIKIVAKTTNRISLSLFSRHFALSLKILYAQKEIAISPVIPNVHKN